MDIGVAHVDAVEHLSTDGSRPPGPLHTSAFSHSGRWNWQSRSSCMQGIMDAPLLKSSFRPGTLKLHVMNVCTSSANVNSWMRRRLLNEL